MWTISDLSVLCSSRLQGNESRRRWSEQCAWGTLAWTQVSDYTSPCFCSLISCPFIRHSSARCSPRVRSLQKLAQRSVNCFKLGRSFHLPLTFSHSPKNCIALPSAMDFLIDFSRFSLRMVNACNHPLAPSVLSRKYVRIVARL